MYIGARLLKEGFDILEITDTKFANLSSYYNAKQISFSITLTAVTLLEMNSK